MSKHSEHYPTFIEHPKNKELRMLVPTAYQHHRQLVAWGLPGLDPVPPAPAESREAQEKANKRDPHYPRVIQHPKTGHRVTVVTAAHEAQQCKEWKTTPEAARAAASGLPAESDDLPEVELARPPQGGKAGKGKGKGKEAGDAAEGGE